MATNFPGSVDDASTVGDDSHPSADELLSSTDGGPAHHALHQNVGLAINAIEDKLGTGVVSTPVLGSVLTGTGSGTSGWSTAPSLDGLTVDTDTLHVDATNNRVGIGTTTPAAELDVSAAVTPKIQLTSEKNGTWVADDPFGEINFYGADTSSPGPDFRSRILSVATDQYGYEGELAFHTTNVEDGDAERVRIDENGNVGIGTTSPAEELHILKDQDSNLTQMMIENIDQRLRVGAYYEAGVAQFAKIQSESDNGNDQALVLNPEGGNVGIGTNFPGYLLDVDGDINASQVRVDGNAIGESETWTPNFLTGVTVGNGTLSGTYQRVNDFVIVQGTFELGSTSAITGDVRVDVPITASGTYDLPTSTFVQMIDTSLNRHWKGSGFTFGPTQVRLRAFYRESNDYIRAAAISSTDPFTWTTGDRLNWTHIYRVGS